jgi:uncharacterized protein (DUF305 family)
MNKSLPKITAAIALTLGAFTLSGCSMGISDIQSGVEDLQNMAEGATQFSDQDLMYAQMMIPHHEQAVKMAELATTRTTNSQVLNIANKIKSAQAPEIAVMAAWLGSKASDMHAGHNMDMNGMLTGAEFAKLEKSVDAQFDQLFVTGMIAHHEGAVEMTQSILKSENLIVKKFGEKVVKDQTAEIEELKKILG